MKKILVVTPEQRSLELVNLLSAEGFEATAVSVMQFMPPVFLTQTQEQLSQITPSDSLIFVSPQAARSYLNLGGKLPGPSGKIYVIGEGTAKVLLVSEEVKSEIIYPLLPENMNAEGLWQIIQSRLGMLKFFQNRIFMIRGGEGNQLIQDHLEKIGVNVVLIETYARACLWDNRQLLQAAVLDKPNLVVLTSFEMAECLFQLWGHLPWPSGIAVTSSSEKTTAFLKARGVLSVLSLKSLSTLGIVDQIIDYLNG